MDDGSVRGSYEQINFPPSKPEVENLIADWFLSSMVRASEAAGEAPLFCDLQPNAENHFDFSITTARGSAYLELQEDAPLNGPYETAPAKYEPYEYAQYILSKIREKSNKYPKKGMRDVYLLIYVTHWAFVLSPTTLACLRVWLQQQPMVFRAIFTFLPIAWGEGESRWIYPVPPELREGFDPETVRDNVCLNLDSANFEVVSFSQA